MLDKIFELKQTIQAKDNLIVQLKNQLENLRDTTTKSQTKIVDCFVMQPSIAVLEMKNKLDKLQSEFEKRRKEFDSASQDVKAAQIKQESAE